MEEYLFKIKEIVNQLALASVIIDDEDLVLLTLNGLPDGFDAFTTTVRSRSETITMDELSALLCSDAIHMEFKTKKNLLVPTVAFLTVKGSSSSSNFQFRGQTYGFKGRNSYRGNRGQS